MGVDFGLLLGQTPRFSVGEIWQRIFEGSVWCTYKIIAVDSQCIVTNNDYMDRPIPKLTFEQMVNTGEVVRVMNRSDSPIPMNRWREAH